MRRVVAMCWAVGLLTGCSWESYPIEGSRAEWPTFAPGGRQVYLLSRDHVQQFDLAARRRTWRFTLESRTPREFPRLFFSSDGSRVGVLEDLPARESRDVITRVLDPATGAVTGQWRATFRAGQGSVSRMRAAITAG